MRNILKRYYELDEETKEILPFLYVYQELLLSVDNYENVNIKDINDEEVLLEKMIQCWYLTDLDIIDIVDRILNLLNNQVISISNLKNFNQNELQRLIYDEELNDSKVITKFRYKFFDCVFCKNKGKYLLIIDDGKSSNALEFNEIKDVFVPLIREHLVNQFLYGKLNSYVSRDD